MVGHMRVRHPWELYLAVVSREFRIPLKMHKCSRVFSASDVVPKMCAKLVSTLLMEIARSNALYRGMLSCCTPLMRGLCGVRPKPEGTVLSVLNQRAGCCLS